MHIYLLSQAFNVSIMTAKPSAQRGEDCEMRKDPMLLCLVGSMGDFVCVPSGKWTRNYILRQQTWLHTDLICHNGKFGLLFTTVNCARRWSYAEGRFFEFRLNADPKNPVLLKKKLWPNESKFIIMPTFGLPPKKGISAKNNIVSTTFSLLMFGWA